MVYKFHLRLCDLTLHQILWDADCSEIKMILFITSFEFIYNFTEFEIFIEFKILQEKL